MKSERNMILIIDDDKVNCDALSNVLESKFDITEAFDIISARNFISNNYDKIILILIDLFISDGDGFKFVEEIKADRRYSDISIVVTAPHDTATYIEHTKKMTESDKGEAVNVIAAHNYQMYIDSVTGIYNRRYYDDKIRDLKGEFAFAMLDVDNFKQINDTYGHDAGDEALRAVADTIKDGVRCCDIVVRYGGDEFFILFRNMPKNAIEQKLTHILHSVEKIKINKYPDMHITVSIGGAYENGKISQILKKADIAMYEAKNARNSTRIYTE